MNNVVKFVGLIFCAVLMSLAPVVASDTVPSIMIVAPQTSDINIMIMIALILITIFVMFIIFKNRFERK